MRSYFLNIAIYLSGVLLTVSSWAAEGHGEGIPKIVFYQTINFSLFALIMGWILFKKVDIIGVFAKRKSEYLAAVQKYEKAKQEAERLAADLKIRLEKLETSAAESIQKAKKDADELQVKLVAEAQQASVKLQIEAKKTVEVETARAIHELRGAVLRHATDAARDLMKQQLKEQDQQRLQQEFVEKIRVVQQ